MKETLCWNCKKTCGGCSWTRSFAPVENWKAIRTKLKIQDERIDSFVVLECPEFEEKYPFNITDRKYPYYVLYERYKCFLNKKDNKIFNAWLKFRGTEACKELKITYNTLTSNVSRIKRNLKQFYAEEQQEEKKYGTECLQSSR